MARKFKFRVKEGDPGESCFLLEEDHGVLIRLQPPADIQYAEKVATFLNASIQDVKVLTGQMVLGTSSGVKAIGGNWASLFDPDGGIDVGNG